MGNLHKWFKGSKSKDGKSGWVNVKTGGTCASDEPGEGTPKCVSSSKRASMTKSERESASRRKKAADPGQQQKSGAAKPTYVSTDKPKKMKKEQFSNWRDDYVATEHETFDVITPEPMKGLSEEDKKGEGSGKKDACYNKVKASAKVWPSAYASGRLVQCRKKGADNYGSSKNEEFVSVVASEYFINEGLNEEGVSELIELLGPVEFGELVYEIAEGVEEELLTEARAGGVKIEPQNKSGRRVADLSKGARTRAINDLRKKKEASRSGEGSGGKSSLKDALKSQSKAAKKPEPKKPEPKKEAAKPAVEKAKAKQPKKRGFLDSVARQVNKGMERHKRAMELARETGKVAKKAATGAGTVAKGVVSGVKDTAKVTKSVADKLKEEYVSELKCWKGYKRKKGSTPGAPGSCVKAGYSDWRGELDLMEGVGAWQRKEGKNKAGGLNEKGRKSYERENPGSDLKAPQPEGGSRKKSFCARMGGMKKKLTSSKTANDPDSRINKSLRKWKC